MTTANRDHDVPMARCDSCDSDLVAIQNRKKDRAYVYCSNNKCKFAGKAHFTGPYLNEGRYRDE